MTDPDQPPTAHGGPPPWAEDDPPTTTLVRLRERGLRWVAVLATVLLAIPAGAWVVDSLAFGRDGTEVAEAVPALADAVALVNRRGCDGSAGTGSGFAVMLGDRPAVLTNRHVVQDAAGVGLRNLEGAAGPDVVEVLLAPDEDVAVLLLDEPMGSALQLGRPPAAGDEVRLVGFPGARPVTSTGPVASVEGPRVLLDLVVDPGASGAPLVDRDGRVVAQVVARTPEGDGVAIPVDRVAAAVQRARTAPGC